ncbi:MAG: sulfite exporter TauE/SafE family protein [Bdellovibrionota bacterium]
MIAILFFVIAILYSMVGFGGGSSYIAILALFNTPYQLIPITALLCNIVVVSGNIPHFFRNGHVDFKFAIPFTLGSIPLSYLGGAIPISRETFLLLLGGCLAVAGLRLLTFDLIAPKYNEAKPPNPAISFLVGSVLGFISGLVGIGGGIFLSPILLLFRWAQPKTVASTASIFIFVNSLAGLFGQISKGLDINVNSIWPLLVVVLIGGQVGSSLSSGWIPQKTVRNLTACLIIFVSAKLLF